MGRNSYVCLYGSYLEALEPYSDAERGRLVTAMLAYLSGEKVPEFTGNERFLWPTIRQQIDRDQENYVNRCLQNRINGAKGGRPRKTAQAKKTEGFSEKPKKPKEKENEKEKEKENEKERENGSGDIFVPPTLAMVRSYCENENIHVSPENFYHYYTASGWKMGCKPMRDWHSAIKTWEERNNGSSTRHEEAGLSPYGSLGRRV